MVIAADLRHPDEARAAIDRLFALGVLSHDLEITRYRGALVGTWRPRKGFAFSAAAAVDGDVLLVALHPQDLRDAVDRRREVGPIDPGKESRLAQAPPGSWKAWSRSKFVASSWEEIVSRRTLSSPVGDFEVIAVGWAAEDRWILRSEGSAPLLAAEPLLPAARATLRALRGQP
jgi:hypothetical protein